MSGKRGRFPFPFLVEAPRSRHEAAEQRGTVLQAVDHDVPHVALALQAARDSEEPRPEHRFPVRIRDPAPDHQIHVTRLVLQRHEDHAPRAAAEPNDARRGSFVVPWAARVDRS